MKKTDASQILKNSSFILIARIIDLAAGLIQFALITRYLGPKMYGDFRWAWDFVLLFQPIINFELDKLIIREFNQRPERAPRILGDVLLIKWFYLLCFIFLPLGYACAGGESAMIIAVSLIVISEVFYQHQMTFVSVFYAYEKMSFDMWTGLVFRIVSLAGIVTCIFADWGMNALIAAILAGNLARAAYGWIKTKQRISPVFRPDFRHISNLVQGGFFLTLAAFFYLANMKVDTQILRILSEPEELALFAVAHTLILQVQMIPFAVVTAIFPALARRGAGPPKEMRKMVLSGTLVLGAVGALAAGFFILVGPGLIRILNGVQFMDAAPGLAVLAWSLPALFLHYLFSSALISLGKQNRIVIASATGLFVNGTLDWLWIPSMGSLGACWGTFFAYNLNVAVLAALLFFALMKSDRSTQ